jgi:NAD(P)-dependent dehydrogenase (short-subunit alcohol dehydrogenase family)
MLERSEVLMDRLCENRVVVITGAGRGIGREYALEFARLGAKVVVNDLGAQPDGSGNGSLSPASQVAQEIKDIGGEAVVSGDDVADFAGAKSMIDSAITHFGHVDVLVNNAGILRDRTIANMDIEEWDAVVRVHLRGTFGPTRWAAAHWRERAKAEGNVQGRLINTASSSGLYANPGQANYAAAKAGIVAFTLVASQELARYGVTANAVYPTALSRLTEETFRKAGFLDDEPAPGRFNPLDPGNIAPVVAWLGSTRSAEITGRVFGVRGGRIVIAEGWKAGPTVEHQGRWDANDLDAVIPALVADARPNTGINGLVSIPESAA